MRDVDATDLRRLLDENGPLSLERPSRSSDRLQARSMPRTRAGSPPRRQAGQHPPRRRARVPRRLRAYEAALVDQRHHRDRPARRHRRLRRAGADPGRNSRRARRRLLARLRPLRVPGGRLAVQEGHELAVLWGHVEERAPSLRTRLPEVLPPSSTTERVGHGARWQTWPWATERCGVPLCARPKERRVTVDRSLRALGRGVADACEALAQTTLRLSIA